MTSMQPHSTDQGQDARDLSGRDMADLDAASSLDAMPSSFGQRLSAAREARGLDLESCATALKLPARVLRQLERDQYDGIDSKIYLASYLRKYGQHLGIDGEAIQAELDRIKQVDAPLVATGGISHSRFLLDRYATAATYVVLTAVIVVPMIWLGVRGTMDRNLTHLAPLDAVPVAQVPASHPASGTTGVEATADKPMPPVPTGIALPQPQDQPLMASMAPFPSLDGNLSSVVARPVTSVATPASGGHGLDLRLAADSWVEVVKADGTRLEYGLLPAGSSKSYRSDQSLEVRIGNASGAEVSIDGQPVGLDAFRRANVAHFGVKVNDGKATATNL